MVDVLVKALQKLMSDNACGPYGIEPLLAIEERIERYEPAIRPGRRGSCGQAPGSRQRKPGKRL